nr:MAG TPA: hypothetical protein [Caudoviricetes sp.]
MTFHSATNIFHCQSLSDCFMRTLTDRLCR